MSKVTSKMLLEDNEIYDEFVEVTLTHQGEEHVIKVYPFISPVKVAEIVDQVQDFLQNAYKEKLIIQESPADLLAYFLVKNTTDVTFTRSKKVKSIYQEFKQLLHSKAFRLIVSTYPEATYTELNERVLQVNNFNSSLEAYEQVSKKAKQDFEGIKKLQDARKKQEGEQN
ncbi:hypothetical protein [Bacillus infantis]|uniref:hypothetical protein n=1 Tax=Bacillus infantis TaxID=324767 RepID=UPI003CEA2B74